MDITFSLQNGQYIAEFKVTSEFNLHIEKGVGSIQMFQRTSGTFFDKVEDFKMNKGDVVYDFDSSSFIGEKTIKIVSEVEPTFAAVTTSGEVTEIKSQSKEVEVTSNGTMDITPDAGFSYLSAVKVKTNVAQSGGGNAGGGGSASGGSGCIRYLNIANLHSLSDQRMAMALACLVKVSSDNQGVVIGSDYFIKDQLYIEYSIDDVVAIGVMPTVKFLVDGNIIGIEEQLAALMGNGATEITEEEFYTL